MGKLIPPEVFTKKRAEQQFSRNVTRIRELREQVKELYPAITPEAKEFILGAEEDMAQIHLLSVYMQQDTKEQN